ncbi:ABC transporter ATP-binding protein [Blastococcus sp. SYSU D00820]
MSSPASSPVPAPPAREGTPLLSVRGLDVTFRTGRRRRLRAVRGIDLDIWPGEVVAVVGESGSGKSSAARGILQLVPTTGGEIVFEGTPLTGLPKDRMRAVRRDMQMVFQDPFSSMNPAMTIEDVIGEPLVVHTDLDRAARRARARELLVQVGLRAEHVDRYPHEFSGGQRQRIAIARAIALNPKLVVADEAVSALDVSSQNQILQLMQRLSRELGIAYLFISHDLGVVRHIADRIAVMYLGTIVEQGPTHELFEQPVHPYTRALLSAALVADPVRQRQRTRIRLTGELPDPASPPPGCPFSSRCPSVLPVCTEQVPVATPAHGPSGSVVCHLARPPAGSRPELKEAP